MRLLHNMSCGPRHHVEVQPLELRRRAAGAPALVLADLGALLGGCRDAAQAATRLLAKLCLRPGGDPVEQLRERIEDETRARGLAGCALVGRVPGRGQVAAVVSLPLALVLLTKSSDVVWVARKTPLVDLATLRRRLITRDPRFTVDAREAR